MTFFKGLMKVLAAAAASVVLPQVIAYFQGPAPSDVSAFVWALIGTPVVVLINWLVGKIQVPAFVARIFGR